MKKTIFVMLYVILVCGLAACGAAGETETADNSIAEPTYIGEIIDFINDISPTMESIHTDRYCIADENGSLFVSEDYHGKTIVRIPLDGQQIQHYYGEEVGKYNGDVVFQLYDSEVFFAVAPYMEVTQPITLKKYDSVTDTIIDLGIEIGRNYIIYQQKVYFIDDASSNIYVKELSGGDAERLTDDEKGDACINSPLCISSGYLYCFCEQDGYRLTRIDFETGEKEYSEHIVVNKNADETYTKTCLHEVRGEWIVYDTVYTTLLSKLDGEESIGCDEVGFFEGNYYFLQEEKVFIRSIDAGEASLVTLDNPLKCNQSYSFVDMPGGLIIKGNEKLIALAGDVEISIDKIYENDPMDESHFEGIIQEYVDIIKEPNNDTAYCNSVRKMIEQYVVDEGQKIIMISIDTQPSKITQLQPELFYNIEDISRRVEEYPYVALTVDEIDLVFVVENRYEEKATYDDGYKYYNVIADVTLIDANTKEILAKQTFDAEKPGGIMKVGEGDKFSSNPFFDYVYDLY